MGPGLSKFPIPTNKKSWSCESHPFLIHRIVKFGGNVLRSNPISNRVPPCSTASFSNIWRVLKGTMKVLKPDEFGFYGVKPTFSVRLRGLWGSAPGINSCSWVPCEPPKQRPVLRGCQRAGKWSCHSTSQKSKNVSCLIRYFKLEKQGFVQRNTCAIHFTCRAWVSGQKENA